jgi:hypothetical protein
MYALGARKGALLEALVRDAAPSRAVEFGTFLGYSALRTARALPPAARLLCLEASPANAAVAAAAAEGHVSLEEALAVVRAHVRDAEARAQQAERASSETSRARPIHRITVACILQTPDRKPRDKLALACIVAAVLMHCCDSRGAAYLALCG